MPVLFHSTLGGVHFASALVALITGALVLYMTKGTTPHRRIGYLYALAMTVMLVTSFGIYNLYHSFGVFHWLGVVSSLTLLGGMLPIMSRWPRNYITFHFAFMYWSVVGLYMAFAAEMAVRLPQTPVFDGAPTDVFYWAVGIAVGLGGLVANIAWFRLKPRWMREFGVDEPAVDAR